MSLFSYACRMTNVRNCNGTEEDKREGNRILELKWIKTIRSNLELTVTWILLFQVSTSEQRKQKCVNG